MPTLDGFWLTSLSGSYPFCIVRGENPRLPNYSPGNLLSQIFLSHCEGKTSFDMQSDTEKYLVKSSNSLAIWTGALQSPAIWTGALQSHAIWTGALFWYLLRAIWIFSLAFFKKHFLLTIIVYISLFVFVSRVLLPLALQDLSPCSVWQQGQIIQGDSRLVILVLYWPYSEPVCDRIGHR